MADEITERSEKLLQNLGLKTYEARSFTALCRIPQGTAKDISELTEVPRTRVYDAMDSLEELGLVEVQHGTPQRYRAIPVEEAIEILRRRYESRIDDLHRALLELEPAARPDDEVQQIWVLTGRENLEIRMVDLIDEADGEVMFLIENQFLLNPSLAESLEAAEDRDVEIAIWTPATSDWNHVDGWIANATVIRGGLGFLEPEPDESSDSLAGLLLIDREVVFLVYDDAREPGSKNAILARGTDNGLVSLTRRLLPKDSEWGE